MNDSEKSAGEILEAIRIRLRARIEADQRSLEPISSGRTAPSVDIQEMHELLLQLSIVHRQLGEINPRPPGIKNSLIQIVKRCLRPVFAWYTRPMVAFQDLTIRLLSRNIRILENIELLDKHSALRQELETLQILSLLPEKRIQGEASIVRPEGTYRHEDNSDDS